MNTSDRNNPMQRTTSALPRVPHGLSEDELLDLVEGRLSAGRAAEVWQLLAGDARLAAMVQGMMSDRMAVAGLPQVQAPAGLVEAVEAKLHAEALRALADQGAYATVRPPAVSRVEVIRPSVFRLMLESAWPRRVAFAACIGLVGYGGMLAVRYVSTWSQQSQGKQMAGPIARPSDTHSTPLVTEPAPMTAIAGASPSPEAPRGFAQEVFATERAIALAREGRLALSLHVRSAEAPTARTLANLASRRGERPGSVRVTRLDPQTLPTALAGLSTPTMKPMTTTQPGQTVPDGPPDGFAGTGGGGPAPANPGVAPMSAAGTKSPVVKAVYRLEIVPSEAAMTSLFDSIWALPGVTLVMRELPVGVEMGVQQAQQASPAEVLWWTKPASEWSRKTSVPVVIETLE